MITQIRFRGTRLAAALVLAAVILPALAPPLSRALAACGTTVTVDRGDTLTAIARRCGIDVDTILDANPKIGDPRLIQPGRVLRLPDSADPAAPADTAPSGAKDAKGAGEDRAATWHRPANRDGLTREGYRPRRRNVQSIAIWPREGEAGSPLTVSASGLPEGPAEIGIGPPGSVWQLLVRLDIGAAGQIEKDVTVPDWARAGDTLVVTLRSGTDTVLTSGDYRVTGGGPVLEGGSDMLPDGSFAVTGRVRQGVECLLLETAHGHLYALSGENWTIAPDTRVSLTGRPADPTGCGKTRGTIEIVAVEPDPKLETIVPPPPSAN